MSVNGQVVRTLGSKVDPTADEVRVDGAPVQLNVPRLWVMLNKPTGYLSTCSDPHGRRTVASLVERFGTRIFPVGRLDLDTEGLLLLTNDGELAYRLAHPKFGVRKTYVADVEGAPSDDALQTLRQGVDLDDGRTSPAKVRVLDRQEGNARVELVIAEGRKRQVRRMLRAVGHPVHALRRARLGPLSLGDLPVGQARELSADEVSALRDAVGAEVGGETDGPSERG